MFVQMLRVLVQWNGHVKAHSMTVFFFLNNNPLGLDGILDHPFFLSSLPSPSASSSLELDEMSDSISLLRISPFSSARSQ